MFHSIYVPDFNIAHSSRTIFHLIVTHSSTVHLISLSDNLFKKCAFAVKISQGYQISINSHSISNALKGNSFTNSLIASVISYSPLDDIFILSDISNILLSNLYTHKLARSQILVSGFSTIFNMFQSTSTLNTPYFSGSGTFFTKTQNQLNLIIFSKSFLSKILSQFIIIISVSDSIHLIAAPVHFSSL
jgi:hypothetical protein